MYERRCLKYVQGETNTFVTAKDLDCTMLAGDFMTVLIHLYNNQFIKRSYCIS